MKDKLIWTTEYAVDLFKAYFFRAPNGFRLASTLAIAFITLQGIKVVSAWLKFELTFPGVDSIPGAIVVVLVANGLILGQCFMSKMVPSQNELFREVLRMRELGFGLAEIEARVQSNRHWTGTIFASIQEHSIEDSAGLSKIERTIIAFRWQGYTLNEIAAKTSSSTSSVHRIEKHAIAKLREWLFGDS